MKRKRNIHLIIQSNLYSCDCMVTSPQCNRLIKMVKREVVGNTKLKKDATIDDFIRAEEASKLRGRIIIKIEHIK